MSKYLGLLLLIASGCGAQQTADSNNNPSPLAAKNEQEKPRIALIMKSLANEFFSTMAKGAEAHQSEHPSDYDLVVNGIKDERDLSRQVAIVDEMVVGGVQAIVIAPADSKALVPALRRAIQAGVVVINIDNRLDVDVMKQEGVSIPFVGPDNRSGAKAVGSVIAAKLSKGDQVAILEGLRTSDNGTQRRLGFEEAMSDAGIQIVDSQSAEWEMAKANTLAASILSEHPEIKALLAANDSMALGALAAVKSTGRTDILIAGFDHISAVQKAIADGSILVTADQHADQLAVFGIEAALAQLKSPSNAPSDIQTVVDIIRAETP